MSSKIAILGDVHLGARNDNQSVMEHQLRFYEQVFIPYLLENHIDTVIQTGDLFDRRKYSNHATLDMWKKRFFDVLRDHDITLFTTIGNHDCPYKHMVSVNSVELLLGDYDNIVPVSNLTEYHFGGCQFLMVPWICDENRDVVMEKIRSSQARYVVGHFELSGFEVQRGMFHEGGLDPETLMKYDVVFSGHFHHKSQRNNILYVGTPYELTWNDFGDTKGFHVFDTETRETEFVRNSFALHNKVFYDDTGKDLDTLLSVDFARLTGTFVKVIVIAKNNPYWYDLFLDKLEKSNPVNVMAVDDHLNLSLEDEKEIIEGAEDVMEIFKAYIDSVDTTVDRKVLENLILSLYNEATALQ